MPRTVLGTRREVMDRARVEHSILGVRSGGLVLGHWLGTAPAGSMFPEHLADLPDSGTV